jgi:hypothetical protein
MILSRRVPRPIPAGLLSSLRCGGGEFEDGADSLALSPAHKLQPDTWVGICIEQVGREWWHMTVFESDI